MGKSMLIIDTPERCEDCAAKEYHPAHGDTECSVLHRVVATGYVVANDRPDWCPLVPFHCSDEVCQLNR